LLIVVGNVMFDNILIIKSPVKETNGVHPSTRFHKSS
jgi:hypothetical protein